MALTFSVLLSPDSIHVDVAAGSKKHALQLLSEYLADTASDATVDDIFDALIERERLGCTAAESGIAIPHARLADISDAHAVLMRLESPIDFDCGEMPTVDLVFGFIAPDDSSDELADDLRRLTQIVVDKRFCDQLRHADDAVALYEVLTGAGTSGAIAKTANGSG